MVKIKVRGWEISPSSTGRFWTHHAKMVLESIDSIGGAILGMVNNFHEIRN